ncbi:MAG TPA: S41 family peptidase [Candidatus Acidoferrum sp.]|nr:S41 family peptidase [Candidatus Acidoferrum sp.]
MKPFDSLASALLLTLGCIVHAAEVPADFTATATSLKTVMRTNHFHPAELDTEAFRKIEDAVTALGKTARTPEEFLNGFNALWRRGPFSHVRLIYPTPAQESPPPHDDSAVTLVWKDNVAILTVNSMSGTGEQIETAYHDIAAHGARKLVIDLRRNGGGAFGVLPLVGHLIDQPLDAGVFVTNRWYRNHTAVPTAAELKTATPCQCTDDAFLADMEQRALTSYRIVPLQPRFNGPVYVVTSAVSISAAEIAADALQASGRATLVGEKTLGLLLQPKRFDVAGNFSLIWPIGDYRSLKNGRIEGTGVSPDVAAPAEKALDVALGL